MPEPTLAGRAVERARSALMQRHLYSFEFYKRVMLTLRWKLMTSDADRLRLEHLATEAACLTSAASLDASPEQRLTDVGIFRRGRRFAASCVMGSAQRRYREPPDELSGRIKARVAGHRAVARRGRGVAAHAPRVGLLASCSSSTARRTSARPQDRFYDAGSLADDAALLSRCSATGTPVASSTRAFLHYRPSQMPGADGHSLGNANRVKADVLFEYLMSLNPPVLPDPSP